MGHVSHSQFVSYNECNLKWKLRYIDKLGTFTGNIHTLFGTAMHTTIQTYLTEMYSKSIIAAESLDLNGLLKTEMMKEFKTHTHRKRIGGMKRPNDCYRRNTQQTFILFCTF